MTNTKIMILTFLPKKDKIHIFWMTCWKIKVKKGMAKLAQKSQT